MKKILSGIVMAASCAFPASAADIEITVNNITEITGMLYWAVYDSAENYRAQSGPVMSARNRVSASTLSLTLHNMPAGRYAVRLFHDANGNGDLDSNALGIPTEGYGFSNNAGKFGPASFEDAAVDVQGDTRMAIRLR
ncbi:MAG: DUF2141 domain-containing protein [Halieaceae bacterium]|nr:DUF2141 domain-containing protein [Halieaceae bacterium]